jgi:hypothetical protein
MDIVVGRENLEDVLVFLGDTWDRESFLKQIARHIPDNAEHGYASEVAPSVMMKLVDTGDVFIAKLFIKHSRVYNNDVVLVCRRNQE